MGVPIEKRLGNVQKALLTGILDGGKSFDPNNPKDVKRRKELEKQVEALQSISSLVTDPTGGGLVGVTKGISKAGFAKMAKSKFTQNKAKQIIDLVTKPMTKGKKVVPKAAKKNTPTVKEVVETKPTIPTTIPSLSNAEIKVFENVKNIRELAEKQAKNISTTTTTAPKKSVSDIIRESIANRKLGTKGFTREEITAYNQKTAKGLQTAKDIVSKNLERVKELKKESETFYQKSVPESIAASNNKAASLAVLAGVLGAGVEATAYGMRLSNKDNKQTTTPQKTGPVDLKRINKNNLKDSSIPGVKKITAIVNGEEKEFGIVWDNKTQSWDYYRDDKTKKTIELPKPDVVKKEDLGGGSGTNTGDRTGSGGTGTTPRSATGQSFDKAFAEARKQAGGAGGIFEWNSKKYGTALRGETVPKDKVEVGKTTTPVTIKNEYPTAKTDPTLEKAMQEDSIKQQRIMYTEKMSKPLSSIVFKPTSKAVDVRNVMDEQDALRSIRADNKLPLKKKRYGGNLAMLKYMKQ